MMSETMRVYDAGRFHDVALPDWYREVNRLSETERLGYDRALDRVLDCEHFILTEPRMLGGGMEILFWPSETHGVFVTIETPLALIEHILIPKPADWLPFLSTYLAPLISASNQCAMIAVSEKLANAFIAWARHGDGDHVNRESGESRIDLARDRERYRAEKAREAAARAEREARS